MKLQGITGIAILCMAVLLAVWLNLEIPNGSKKPVGPSGEKRSGAYVLAVSWQPAFCEQRPSKPECRSQHESRFDANQFSLHGLWPETNGQRYCGIDRELVDIDKRGGWSRLPKLDLSDGLREELAQKMPGYRSFLHRHEWYKHGSCMRGYSQEEYFAISLNLLDQLNNSAVRTLFAKNKGRRLRFNDVAQAFKTGFGQGSESRVVMDCYRDDGRRIIHEFKLSIEGKLHPETSLSEVLLAAPKVGRSCPAGIVDRVGLQ